MSEVQTEFTLSGFFVSFYKSRDGVYKIGEISSPSLNGMHFYETVNLIERYQKFLSFVSDKLKELNANNSQLQQ